MRTLPGALLVLGLAVGAGLAGCATQAADDPSQEDTFSLGEKHLLPPELFDSKLRVTVGEPEKEPLAQPISFPHNRHVSVLGMDCEYCHSGARKGFHAGVPPTQVCMGCHKMIDPKNRTLMDADGKTTQLERLAAYYDSGENIPWVKVHDLPDYVYFSHKRHVLGGVQCQECHGAVQEMTVNQRVASLKMGWCLDCHATHPKIDENYGDKAELRRAELKDCYTCHK